MLRDQFGRIHDYLRVSLTDRCNFRCLYCMPEPEFHQGCKKGSSDFMNAEEIIGITSVFVGLGVQKIRITGGEPLVRKDAGQIISRLSKLPVELAITTNGARIHEFLDCFREGGIKSVNVSLDSLNRSTFAKLTGRDEFNQVMENINLLLSFGYHVKINMVVMNGYNHHELNEFIEWTRVTPVHIRFIEFMPFPGNHWRPDKLMNFSEIMEIITRKYTNIVKLNDGPHDTAKKFRVAGHSGTFAVISTMSEPFCSGCNRLRLTSDGKFRNCLFAKNETDLLTAYRDGRDIRPVIEEALYGKHWMLGGNAGDGWAVEQTESHKRSMVGIGG